MKQPSNSVENMPLVHLSQDPPGEEEVRDMTMISSSLLGCQKYHHELDNF